MTAGRASLPLDVLVVDDEPLLASAIAGALHQRGHRVTTAHGAFEALQAPAQDVAVVDVRLEGGTGFDLVDALRRRGPLPCLFTSGLRSIEAAREAKRLGAHGFLVKPFRMAELVAAVEEAAARPLRPLPHLAS